MQSVAGEQNAAEVDSLLEPVDAVCFPDMAPVSGHFDVLFVLYISEPGMRAAFGPSHILLRGR